MWSPISLTHTHTHTHTHTQSFPYPFSPVKDRQRMCLWLGKTHISSLRFHIPGIPSEDHCSPFKTIPHMEEGGRDPGHGRWGVARKVLSFWEIMSIYQNTVPLSVNKGVFVAHYAEWEDSSFIQCSHQKSYHDGAPVVLPCGNSKLHCTNVNLKTRIIVVETILCSLFLWRPLRFTICCHQKLHLCALCSQHKFIHAGYTSDASNVISLLARAGLPCYTMQTLRIIVSKSDI